MKLQTTTSTRKRAESSERFLLHIEYLWILLLQKNLGWDRKWALWHPWHVGIRWKTPSLPARSRWCKKLKHPAEIKRSNYSSCTNYKKICIWTRQDHYSFSSPLQEIWMEKPQTRSLLHSWLQSCPSAKPVPKGKTMSHLIKWWHECYAWNINLLCYSLDQGLPRSFWTGITLTPATKQEQEPNRDANLFNIK